MVVDRGVGVVLKRGGVRPSIIKTEKGNSCLEAMNSLNCLGA